MAIRHKLSYILRIFKLSTENQGPLPCNITGVLPNRVFTCKMDELIKK